MKRTLIISICLIAFALTGMMGFMTLKNDPSSATSSEENSFLGKLNSTFSYTFSRNRYIDFTDDGNTYDGNDLPGIPDQYAQLQFSWNPVKKLQVFTHLQYNGNQYLNDSNTLKYTGYFLAT